MDHRVGYRLIASRGPEGMHQGYHVYVGDVAAIRVIADRGQWFVDVRPDPDRPEVSGWVGWFNLEAWGLCLGIEATFHSDSGRWPAILANSWRLAPQLDWLEAHLAEVQAAAAPERAGQTRLCLSEAQRALSAFPPRDGGSFRGVET